MAGLLDSYTNEIFHFLRTVTIKFEPFAYIMGEKLMNQYGFADPHGKWNPYYINLSGEYADGDTRMTVYSIEEERVIPFNKDTIKEYPKTATIYRIPHQEYNILEERYPDNIGLIRTIAYSTPDISDILSAPNFALLGYDDSLLHINERESLMRCLRTFLDMVRTRWWVPEFGYEDMYAVTFWAMLWQMLPVVLLTERFKNIRTPSAHPFHIWEYLKSKGLGDYRDVLTNNQSLWLYRNIDYIQKNQGKNSNLRVLAQNLLEEIAVSLLYKDMNHETDTRWPELMSNPRFRSYNLVTKKEILEENFTTLNHRLFNMKIEHRDDAEFVDDWEVNLGTTNYNRLPTKYLELKKEPINTGHEKKMVNYFLHTLLYRLSENDLAFQVKLIEPTTQSKLELYVGDLLLLMGYSIWKGLGEEPVYLPRHYPIYYAFQKNQPTSQVVKPPVGPRKLRAAVSPRNVGIRQYIYYNGKKFPVRNQIDLDNMINKIGWHEQAFTKQSDFMEFLIQQYVALKRFDTDMENSSSYMYHSSMAAFFEDTQIHETVPLYPDETYKSWMAKNEDIQNLILAIENNAEPEGLFEEVAVRCFDALFPIKESTDKFVGTARVLDSLYNAIRNLFISLGGYNVTYLEIDRERREYLKIEESDVMHMDQFTLILKGMWNFILERFYWNREITHRLEYQRLIVDFAREQSDTEFGLWYRIEVDPSKLWLMKSGDYRRSPVDMPRKLLTQNIQSEHQVQMGTISCRMRSINS